MGNPEDAKPTKAVQPSTPPPLAVDQSHVNVYPDWAAAQAYYGPRVAVPPYYNSAVPPGYAPHPYIWGPPQHMIPPYGAPYAAAYSHGGVYAHPAAPITPPTPVTEEAPSSGDAGRGLMKKLKSFDGIGMSMANGNAEPAENGAKPRVSESTETEGASDGSDGDASGADQTKRKRMYDVAPLAAVGKSEGGAAPDANSKAPAEAWLLNERELKWERRKQSNRESARRSRLRKQAEAEELANRVGYLSAENAALTSEIKRLMEDSENLGRENAKLVEKLKYSEAGGTGSGTEVEEEPLPLTTENLLSKVDNAGVSEMSTEEEQGYARAPNLNVTGSKLHQLLSSKPRADAMAAT